MSDKQATMPNLQAKRIHASINWPIELIKEADEARFDEMVRQQLDNVARSLGIPEEVFSGQSTFVDRG